MKTKIAQLGIAHSGTNLIKNIFLDLFKNNKYKPYKYYHRGHNKNTNGKLWMDVDCLNDLGNNLLAVLFNYRNEFDRRFSTSVRGMMSDKKGSVPSDASISIEDYKDEIVCEVEKLLKNTWEMEKIKNKYDDVLNAKKDVILKCRHFNATPIILEYERFYENFDYIFNSLNNVGITINEKDKRDAKSKHSAKNVFKMSRSKDSAQGVSKEYNFLSNHVSYTLGEPYYWAKFMDFNAFFKSLPSKNKQCFIDVVSNHPHKNLVLM